MRLSRVSIAHETRIAHKRQARLPETGLLVVKASAPKFLARQFANIGSQGVVIWS
jgi:hypothetical protein